MSDKKYSGSQEPVPKDSIDDSKLENQTSEVWQSEKTESDKPSLNVPLDDSFGHDDDTVTSSVQPESSRSRRASRPPTTAETTEMSAGRRHKKDTSVKRGGEVNITVEIPDGQRIVVRSRPDHTVKYLLDVCCKRINVNPNDHYFVLDYKELNEGVKVSAMGFTQNDVIKLFKGKKTILHRKIRVIIKVRDVRVGSIFKDTDNLWYIIKVLLAREYVLADLVPIVLYNKEEFIGVELLSRVRLRDIGVTTGTCTMKFLQLKKEDLNLRGLKTDDDENVMTTLESLEVLAAGPAQDTGLRTVTFKTEDDSRSLQYIGDRKALAFKLSDVAEEEIEEVLRDEFFDITGEEISCVLKELIRKTPEFENMNPGVAIVLAREEMEELRTRKICDETIIRVQLPDQMALQGIFSPDETINDVKDFVRKYVRDPGNDFEIYRYNVNDILNPASCLKDLNCIPSAKLYMGGSMRMSSFEHVLLDDVNLVSSASADEAALFLRGDSLEQFFSSFDRDSFEGGKSGLSYALRNRSKKQSLLSFLRKSSGGIQRRLRKSLGKESIASKASASSNMSRARRSLPVDPSQLPSAAVRSSQDDDFDEADQRRDTTFDDDDDDEEPVNSAGRRDTAHQLERSEYFRESVDDRDTNSPSLSAIQVPPPSTSKSNNPTPETRR